MFFQMLPFLNRVFHLNNRMSKRVCVYLGEDLLPLVKITTRKGHVVLNKKHWLKLINFNEYTYRIHSLISPGNNLFMTCGRSVRIRCDKKQVVLLRRELSYLMLAGGACLNEVMDDIAQL